ncbi:MAG TPA: histidine kinase [Gemmatimonadales bacterium]
MAALSYLTAARRTEGELGTIPHEWLVAAALLGLTSWVLLNLGHAPQCGLLNHCHAPTHSLVRAVIIDPVAMLLACGGGVVARSPDEATRTGASGPNEAAPLVTQLQAHFLLNVLNDAAELVHVDPDAADEVITAAGEFLRAALLHTGRAALGPLGQELHFMRAYIDIQAVRHRDRLTATWPFAPDALDAVVPIFIWQPILENAFRHGGDPATGRVDVEVGARREGSELVLWVRDHGRGPGPGAGEPGHGVGLANTRERLAAVYGTRGSLQLQPAQGGGALATIRLPYAISMVGRETSGP